jgi:hypothetical protein
MPEEAPVTMAVLPEMSIRKEPFGWFVLLTPASNRRDEAMRSD